MSRFYGSMKGARGETTRCGNAVSGITGHLRGWDIGVQVYVEDMNGQDVVRVYLTGGSNGSCQDVYLGTFRRVDGGIGKLYMGEDVPYVYKAGEE